MGLTAVQLRVPGELSRLESMGACEINQKDIGCDVSDNDGDF